MKPLDIIRTGLDAKDTYSFGIVCEIVRSELIKGIGLILQVKVLRSENIVLDEMGGRILRHDQTGAAVALNPEVNDLDEEIPFSVICTNREYKENPGNISEKYYAYVLPMRKNKLFFAPALLIPKTVYALEDMTEDAINGITTEQIENILDKSKL